MVSSKAPYSGFGLSEKTPRAGPVSKVPREDIQMGVMQEALHDRGRKNIIGCRLSLGGLVISNHL